MPGTGLLLSVLVMFVAIHGSMGTPPPLPTNCNHEGQLYPTESVIQEPACGVTGLYCTMFGQVVAMPGVTGCCEYDGQYYEDGETVTRPDGVVCYCEGGETGEPVPVICPETTVPPPEPTPAPEPTPPQPPPGPPGGCWFEGQFYPAGAMMREPGCFRSGVVCADEWGGTLILDQFGYGCCEYDGQYYVDGETLTRPDGVVCYCVGSTVDWEAAPMICPACSVDVVFVVDDSSSITSSMVAKQYMKYFLQCFNQDAWVYVGVILFNCVPRTAIPLGNYTVSDPALPGHIDMLMKEGGLSRIGVAISYMAHTSNFRDGAHRVAVVLTDGYADGNGHESTMDDYAAQADAARDAGITLYSLGIGGQVNSAALQAIGGGPGNVFGTGDPCELANRILQELCGFDTDEPPTTTPQPPPPTTTTPIPPGCEYGGQFYPPGTTIEEVPGCMGHVVLCDQNGQILIGDNFGFNCCEYNGQYYEDGETVTRPDGVVCYCEGSETGEPAPMICPEPPTTIPPGCEYQGQFYPPGATIEEVPGCNGHVVYCDQDGQIQFLDFFGYNCCEYNGQLYEDGQTVTRPDGVVCYCEGSDNSQPAPMICPTTTTKPLPPTTIPPGCEYGGQFYPPDTTIEEVPGCMGHGVYCDYGGQLLVWDNFGYNCCVYNGHYYEDGETVTMSDGVVCHCEGSDNAEAAPMTCPSNTSFL